MQILTGLGTWPDVLAFSPDGRYLAASDYEGLRVWDLAYGPGPVWSVQGVVHCSCFTPDGSAVLSGAGTAFSRHDIRTGAMTNEPSLFAFNPERFSPDGRYAFSVVNEPGQRTIRMRCARPGPSGWTEAWNRTFRCKLDHDWSLGHIVLFSPDGERLARVTASRADLLGVASTQIEVLSTESGESVEEWFGELPSPLRKGAVDPNGPVVLLQKRTFYAIDAAERRSKPVKCQNASNKHFTSVAFSRDGTRLATISNDASATIWDAATYSVRKRYEWQIGRLRAVCFAPDGLRCAAGGSGQIVVWDLDD
jgi:WD40 repeat protein